MLALGVSLRILPECWPQVCRKDHVWITIEHDMPCKLESTAFAPEIPNHPTIEHRIFIKARFRENETRNGRRRKWKSKSSVSF